MGLIEQEIQEIRKMAKDVMSGQMTPEVAAVQIGFFNQTSKRVSQMIQIAALSAKNKRSANSLVAANVIGDGQAIQIENTDIEVVKCPEKGDRCISRDECLDYSGSEQNINHCQSCEHFSKTRKYCLSATE